MKLNLVQVFWGDGKGKTTSALGTALRACGNNYKVHLIQFMKNGAETLTQQTPGEISALNKFDNFSYKRFGAGTWIIGEPKKEHFDSVEEAFNHLEESLEKDYDVLIADEILYAIQLGLLEESRLIDLINKMKKEKIQKELILTGSHKPLNELFKHSDLVTEVRKVKHPYDSGIDARKGIDY